MQSVLEDFSALEHYREDWNNLSDKHSNALLSYEWFSCCASAFHSNDKLYIVCIIDNGELTAVAPLCKSNSDRHLQIIGSQRLYEPSSLLFKDENALDSLLDACFDIQLPILFSRCFPHKYCGSNLVKYSPRGLFITRPSANSQFLEIKTDFLTYENSLPSRKRYDIRRSIKKANKYGDLKYNIYYEIITNVNTLLEKAFEIENLSWKRRYGSSIMHNDDLKSFFSCLFNSNANDNKVVISFLSINNQSVATQLSLNQYGKLWVLKIGYDENYASCSPGVILMHKMIRYAYENELDSVEFLGNEEIWINSWKPATRKYYNQILYPFSYKGLVAILFDGCKILIDKIKCVIFK